MPFLYDPTFIILIPAILLALFAQTRVQTTFNKYSKVASRSGITGAQVAASLLRSKGLDNVKIEPVRGKLTDHYDPRTKTLRLSEEIYSSTSLAALGIAAHEVGHAYQHSEEYGPLKLRNGMVPAVNIGSNLAFPLLLIGLLFSLPTLALIGVIGFSFAVLFHLITLPVEYNASNRALLALETGGYLNRDEVGQAGKVLNAAALTYVAATVMAVLQLLRLLIISGLLGDKRRR